ARTVVCPHCEGLVPLSPTWRLTRGGEGVRLRPNMNTRRCEFEIVTKASDQSAATVARGDGLCPFPDCGRPIAGDHIKLEAQAGQMGEQLFAVVYKRQVLKLTKSGRQREAWEQAYRAPTAEDDASELVAKRLGERIPLWEADDLIPNERIPEGLKTDEPRRYGMNIWRDLF